jgi:hypothetical protein
METKIIEATNGPWNWGKFMVTRLDPGEAEWDKRSQVSGDRWLRAAWAPNTLLVVDLETGEGVMVNPGGSVHADLEKHQVWVCPLFEPFLGWLYKQDIQDLQALPDLVDLPDAEFQMAGYRRPGPAAEEASAL